MIIALIVFILLAVLFSVAYVMGHQAGIDSVYSMEETLRFLREREAEESAKLYREATLLRAQLHDCMSRWVPPDSLEAETVRLHKLYSDKSISLFGVAP